MLNYGEPIKKDISDIEILVYATTLSEEPIIVNENQFYELIDRLKIGDRLHIIVFDGYGYDILSFVTIITSNIDKNMLKEKIRRAIDHWKNNQYKQK